MPTTAGSVPRPAHRPTVGRKALVTLAALLPLAAGLLPAPAAAAGSPAVAPYVDMGESDESLLDTATTSDGLNSYTAAFIIGEGCTQEWGDTEPVGNDPYIDPEIARAKSEGASVIISSGGADGYSIPWTCTDQSTIDSALQSIITDYGTDELDFDIEGAAVADTASATRLFTAMNDLKASNPGLRFSVTLPVLPTGLDNYGIGIVQAAANVGVTIDVVNIMAMDYYQGDQEMGTAAINAAEATLSQLRSIDPGYTYANVGITPMIGVNDDGSTFTLADARSVRSWAASNGIGRLSFWSLTRDQSCGGSTPAAIARPMAPASSPTCSGVTQDPLAFTSAFLTG